MKQLCPKCGSRNTYKDGFDLACLMCGKRSPINGQQSVVINKKIGRERIMEKSPSGKTGICLNCERSKFISGADGFCSTCHTSVKGLSSGTPDYDKALATVKERLTDRANVKFNKAVPRLRAKASARMADKSPKKTKSTLDMTVKEVAQTGIAGIIQRMRDERACYLSEAEKLGKAINILESI